MLVLGVESSCDDMGAAVVKDGRLVLSNVVASQDSLHAGYGGVVPEIASRRHIETVVPVVCEALKRAGLTLDSIDGIGVTRGPGLVGSILIGLNFAKAVSYVKKKPFVGVNHLEAHALSAFLEEGDVPGFPFTALVVSGGHTVIFLVEDFTSFKLLGRTRDDAAGEAFDKVAKLLGLGYPGGVMIDNLSKEGNRRGVEYTRPYISRGNLDFSFSGLKTAVLNTVKGFEEKIPDSMKRDIAASFQEAVVDVLVQKALWAVESTGTESLVVAGGVACNSRLRERLKEAAEKKGLGLFIPRPQYCSDNGAMVALSAHHLLERGVRSGLDLDAVPS